MKDKQRFFDLAAPLLLSGALIVVYLATLAPGLTWANDGADGGDLIAAAATGGVAHPTGYPVYLLIARLFQLLPIGSLAYRTNLLSAIAMTSASVLIYFLVKQQLNSSQAWLPAIISGFAFGLSPLAWSQAVITEVYALNALFVALVLYLSVVMISEKSRKHADVILGLLLGLGIGVHATIILLIPVVILIRLLRPQVSTSGQAFWKRWPLDWMPALRTFAFILIGWTPHLLLPLWAASHPPVNWGDPITWPREWWLVSGQLYRDNLFGVTYVDLWSRLQLWAGLVIGQFGLAGLLIGLLGLTVFFAPSRLMVLSIWNVLVYSLFAINYNTGDWYVYLIPVFLSIAIWIGIGTHGLIILVSRHWRPGWLIGIALLFYLLVLSIARWSQVDASHDTSAEVFGHQVMIEAPSNAFVFVQGDQAIFAIWYFHYALHQRPDIVVVAPQLLSFDWYQQTIRATYPQLNLPGQFPWPVVLEVTNPSRPVCFVRYSGQADIQCPLSKSSTP